MPDEFRARYRDAEWRAMAGMRDRLIHDYFGVDLEIVWDVVQHHIPRLRAQVGRDPGNVRARPEGRIRGTAR